MVWRGLKREVEVAAAVGGKSHSAKKSDVLLSLLGITSVSLSLNLTLKGKERADL